MATFRVAVSGILCCLCWLCCCQKALARQQEESLPAAMENQLENEAAGTETVSEDDAQWQHLYALQRHKIQLNTADEAALQSIGLLTPLQISHFLRYKALLGDLLSIYELQAVPGFEPEVIRRILPYVTVGNDLAPHYTLRDYAQKGDHVFLLRYGRVGEQVKGYRHTDTTLPAYQGSPDKVFMRYRYSFPRYMSWGIVMEKDAGEAFFKGAQKQGFDFYSAHLFVRNFRKIKALAFGDYTVNLGQGLLNWQGQAYGKGAAVMQVKREGEVLRPYTSAGEFYFFRGVGITWQQQRWEVTAFASQRRQDASTDTLMDEVTAASIISSGYHRTASEAAKRGAIQQTSTGGNIRYTTSHWQWGINIIQHRFTPVLQKEIKPYNQFDFNGAQLTATSVDYAGSWKNVHLFGEVAASDNGKPAIVQGLLTSVAPSVDMAVVYRYYDRAYQSLYAKGFGDGYRTANEQGLYTGITLKLNARWKMDAYADVFHFPWLKYRSNAPSGGKDFFVQASYTPNKKMLFLWRYNYRQGQENLVIPENPLKVLTTITSAHLRFQWNIKLNRQLEARTRLEYSRYQAAGTTQSGWMIYQDGHYSFPKWPLGISGRLTFFRTSSYDSRIYATESSVLYENAVSQLYGRGWQYYVQLKWKVTRRFTCQTRWHQTRYPGVMQFGSGNEQIAGNKKTLYQCQLLYMLTRK
ncbi:ComEA family DNA-binding protein [Chitinophaga arvensicola]|uniref:Helix-hairpin-helix motif-containing protein n=1 Tax=Chitinophaga arvensicola TaxID=29529 RepID=A0A1I0SCU1_9BACT|nr:helix-hairpin-helix domain-containing protein [Chitinophaga arvensicola]SEW55386.1 Helix-hairpin-helix motif-containing protein [Chitinophaga arvensicola]